MIKPELKRQYNLFKGTASKWQNRIWIKSVILKKALLFPQWNTVFSFSFSTVQVSSHIKQLCCCNTTRTLPLHSWCGAPEKRNSCNLPTKKWTPHGTCFLTLLTLKKKKKKSLEVVFHKQNPSQMACPWLKGRLGQWTSSIILGERVSSGSKLSEQKDIQKMLGSPEMWHLFTLA